MSAAPPWSSSRAPMSAASDSAVGHNSTISPSAAAASRWCKSSRPASSASAGSTMGPSTKAKLSSTTAMPTRRSRQPPPRRTYCRSGSASKNSLASRIIGPPGTSASIACHAGGVAAVASVSRCRARNTGLVSTRCKRAAATNSGAIRRHVRPASAAERAASGAEFHQPNRVRRTHRPPDLDAPRADQLAEHLADLRRGGEVAGGAERIAGRVVAVFRMSSASAM